MTSFVVVFVLTLLTSFAFKRPKRRHILFLILMPLEGGRVAWSWLPAVGSAGGILVGAFVDSFYVGVVHVETFLISMVLISLVSRVS